MHATTLWMCSQIIVSWYTDALLWGEILNQFPLPKVTARINPDVFIINTETKSWSKVSWVTVLGEI